MCKIQEGPSELTVASIRLSPPGAPSPDKDRLHQAVCDDAYAFRYSPANDLLLQQRRSSSEDVWIRLRHYIGRLGYWHETAAFRVQTAPQFASVLCNYEVRSIPYVGLNEQPHLKLDHDLRRLVERVFPNFRESPLCDELVSRLQGAEKLIEWFRSNELIPRPHAEVVVLDYFFTQGLKVMDDDFYIGCSKASCYCCALYFKHHPGKFLLRPSHGNTWLQWCLPQPFVGGENNTSNLNILRRMANETRAFAYAWLTNSSSSPQEV